VSLDRFIAAMPAEEDADLMLCRGHGLAYQKDRAHIVNYDGDYYEKCRSYEDKEIALKINAGRIALVNRLLGQNRVVDIGIGSGEFIKKRPNTFGRDVNPVAIEWLKRNDLWAEHLSDFAGCTFWDVIEHVPEPEQYFRHIQLHSYLFTSVPIFYGLGGIRQSKHYRPGEHLYYWTEDGFINWMDSHGFMQLGRTETFEIDAGRESIYSFAFKRYRWPN
jgi:methyltransferase family protein